MAEHVVAIDDLPAPERAARTRRANARGADLETLVRSGENEENRARKIKAIQALAAGYAAIESPRDKMPDAELVARFVENVKKLRRNEQVSIDVLYFVDYEAAIQRVRHHPWIARDVNSRRVEVGYLKHRETGEIAKLAAVRNW